MMDVGRHPNITLLTNSSVAKVEGKAGDFSIQILKRPRYVNITQCTACGDCSKVCPIVKPSEFDLGLASRKAIFTPYNQAIPSAYVRAKEDCLGDVPIACGKCIDACKNKCIDFDELEQTLNIKAGAIVVSTGVEYYDPREASEYGYTRFENVVTSFELERLLDASSPTHGELLTFSTKKPPKRIAMIQCVGSRNMKADINYCSRICCMNSIKDTLVIREHYPDAEIMVFYIDIRAFGKGFEEFYRRSLAAGVKYIKGKPSKITEIKKTKEIVLSYEDQLNGEIKHEVVDMAVLSSAMIPNHGSKDLSMILGIELDPDGFFKEKDPCVNPLESTKEGIYLCGCSTTPKDITDSIAESCGAAAKAGVHMSDAVVEEKTTEITELDPSGPPRIGVFLCHCGLNISAVVSINELREYASGLPDVVMVDDYLFACAESMQKKIQDAVLDHRLNRIVVAACTPKTHEPVFQETLAKIGFNPYLFDMANIRNQCSWVHQKEPAAATAKSKEIIKMSVARVRYQNPLAPKILSVRREILVVGGGITGIQAAIDLASRGFKVFLVEKQPELGGRVRNLASVYPSNKPGKSLVEEKIRQLYDKAVTVLTGVQIRDVRGYVGNFEVELVRGGGIGVQGKNSADEISTLGVGAIILAIGAELFDPVRKFGFGEYPDVFTSMQLEDLLTHGSEGLKNLKSVVFIQCVGSREEEGNTWCSRYCCQSAIKQAILLRKMGIDVTIFHRGIRVYSKGAEVMYRRARELGVLFIPYSELARGEMPEVTRQGDALQVEMDYEALNSRIIVPVDAVILSVGMVPNARETDRLSDILKVPKGPDSFFLERHSKFGPVETTVEGVFLAGCCQFPQDIGDSVSQGSAVASKAAALLSRDIIVLPPITSAVDEQYCRGCGKCAEVCDFHAISVVEKDAGIFIARVNEALCKGCGTCVPVCPTGAIDLKHFTEKQLTAQLEALLDWSESRIV